MAPSHPPLQLGELLRRERKRQGWKQADLARVVGVSQQTVAKWESGQRPHSRHLSRLAEVLDQSEPEVVVLAHLGHLDGARTNHDGAREPKAGAAPGIDERLAALEAHVRELDRKCDLILGLLERDDGGSAL